MGSRIRMLLISRNDLSVGKIAEPDEVTKIGRFYGAVEKELQLDFRSLTPINFTNLKGIEFKKNVEREVQTLNRGAVKWSNEAVPDAYIDAAKKAELLLKIEGEKPDPLFDDRIHKRTIVEETEKTNEFYLKANVSINMTAGIYTYLMAAAATRIARIESWDMRDEETIANLLDEAIERGASRWAVAKLVMGHFEGLIGDGQFININGRNYNVKKYSKMVARTRLRKVQSEAVIRMSEEYETDLVQVSDHGTTTEKCLEFEGNVYSISGKSKNHPVLTERPPYHPNCQHNISPTSERIIARNPQRRVSQQPWFTGSQ